MAEKSKAKSKEQNLDTEQHLQESENSTEVLSQLREIVFGQSQRDLQHAIATLQQTVQNELSEFRSHHETVTQQLHASIEQLSQTLSEKLDTVNHYHEEKQNQLASELDKAVKTLSSEIEMTDSAGKDDTQELHNRVDSEIRDLTSHMDQQFSELLAKLDAVTQELSSSKTDRKTLAKLLSTMAVNLEADDND